MNKRALREVDHGRFLATNEAEHVWGWESPAGRQRALRRADLILQGAELCPGKRVLEIGCGTGNFTEIFLGSGAEIVAVDISPDLLAQARARNLPPDKVQFLEKQFEDCDVDGPFDAIIGSSVLHHLELILALTKMQRLLKPGGLISFAEPNFLNPQIFLERKFRRFFPSVSPDETAFVSWKLKKDLLRTGFQNIKIEPFDWLHPATPAFMIGVVKAVGGLIERVPIVRQFSGSLIIQAGSRHDA